MKKLIKGLAKAAVYSGVNVQPGEEVHVRSSVYAVELTREIVKLCYERGAKRVIVDYRDDEIGKLTLANQSLDTLTHKPQFVYDERIYFADVNGCVISILCDNPDGLKHVDSAKLSASVRADMKALSAFYDKTMSHKIKWTVIAYPHPDWAKLMFPELKPKAALKKLGKYIAKTSRVDCDDPAAAWRAHSEVLRSRSERLNALGIKSLHYKNALGTDLVVGLPEAYVFEGGEHDCNGVPFNANIPSEEVFTAPDCHKIDGVVYASMPLCYGGKIIDGLMLKLENGKIVDYDAKTNRDLLATIIDTDDGAKSLGEVALVPYSSPISKLKTLFYETLFDENASCHFAIGEAYPTCIKGGADMTKAALKKSGLNYSDVHIDFMIGTKDLSITATLSDGSTVDIFVDGDFAEKF